MHMSALGRTAALKLGLAVILALVSVGCGEDEFTPTVTRLRIEGVWGQVTVGQRLLINVTAYNHADVRIAYNHLGASEVYDNIDWSSSPKSSVDFESIPGATNQRGVYAGFKEPGTVTISASYNDISDQAVVEVF